MPNLQHDTNCTQLVVVIDNSEVVKNAAAYMKISTVNKLGLTCSSGQPDVKRGVPYIVPAITAADLCLWLIPITD